MGDSPAATCRRSRSLRIMGMSSLAFGTLMSNFYLVVNVIIRRKKFGIGYPAVYADKSHIDGKKCKDEKDVEEFNCAQRAHQNTVENMGTVQLLGAVNGLVFPTFSGSCLAIYAVGRVVY